MYLANEDSGEERRRKKWKEGKNEEARGRERKENKELCKVQFFYVVKKMLWESI